MRKNKISGNTHTSYRRFMALVLVIVSMTCTACSASPSAIPYTKMTFHTKDGSAGRGGADTGIVSAPVYADFVTESVCAIAPEEAAMTDSNLPAAATMMIDVTNNELIFANNIYGRIYPASITKMLTALMVIRYGDLNAEVTIREDDMGITIPGAKLCNFKKGDVVTVDVLLNSLMIYSGNDAALALAEYISGSEEAFCELMNSEAYKLGAVDTHFINPHGLHDTEHYTTAYDMYLVFNECLKSEYFKEIINQSSYTAVYRDASGTKKEKLFKNTNQFLSGETETPYGVTVFGGKTGSTGNAGDCLIIYSESDDGTGYITAVFKASGKASLYKQMSYLLSKE